MVAFLSVTYENGSESLGFLQTTPFSKCLQNHTNSIHFSIAIISHFVQRIVRKFVVEYVILSRLFGLDALF